MFPSRRIVTSGGDVFRNEYSLEFDGSDSYVDCGTAIGTAFGDSYDGGLTVSAWVKSDVADRSPDQSIFAIDSYDADGDSEDVVVLKLGHEGTYGSYHFITRASKNSFASFTDTADATSWHHIAGVFDGANNYQYLYLDGILKVSTAQSNPLNLDGLKTIIGSFDNVGDNAFNGKIDEVAIWNTALSSSQVKTLYNNREPFNAKNIALSNLKGYWRMGDGVLDHRITNGVVADQVNATLGAEMWDSNASTFEGGSSVYSWETYGDNVLSNDGNTLKSVFGSTGNTGAMKIIFSNAKDLNADLIVGALYRFQLDIKINTGHVDIEMATGSPAEVRVFTGTTFETHVFYFLAASTTGDYLKIRDFSSGEIVHIDNLSLKPINGNAGVMVNFDGTDFKTDTH